MNERENLLNQEIWREESYRHSLQRFDQYIFAATAMVSANSENLLNDVKDEDLQNVFTDIVTGIAFALREAADKAFFEKEEQDAS